MREASWILLVCLVLLVAAAGAAPLEDRRGDGDYLETQIKHLSDVDLFAALDLDRPALAAVKKAVNAGDYPAAYRAWTDYWAVRDKITLVEYETRWSLDGSVDGELLPMAVVEARLRADPAQGAFWVRHADPVMRHQITGWGSVTHQHGEVVDFNFDYGESGKYGFHYWEWAKPLLMAAHATGDPRYLAEFDLLFNQWYEQRDAVKGAAADLDVIWYELGLGLRNRQFLHYYTCPFPPRPLATHERMLKTVLGAARLLMTYAARIGELEGLPYHGIEAVLSRGNGKTWNWNRRYILFRELSDQIMHSPGSVMLSDGSILTTFLHTKGYSWDDGTVGPKSQKTIGNVSAVIWKP